MRPIWHTLSSFVLAVAIFFFTRFLGAAVVALLAGVFIDSDHLIDYWALKPQRPFSVRDFLDSEKYNKQAKFFFLFLHGWEWLALLIIFTWVSGWNVILLSLTLSVVLHLALDCYNQINDKKANPLAYFFFFRVLKGFNKKKIAICLNPKKSL